LDVKVRTKLQTPLTSTCCGNVDSLQNTPCIMSLNPRIIFNRNKMQHTIKKYNTMQKLITKKI